MNRELAAFALKIVHITWLSVALGIGLEVVFLALLAASGGNPTVFGFVAGVTSKVAWSVVVCAALAVASAIPRVSVPAAGLAGMLVAPPAAITARVIQKVVTEALSGAASPLPLGLVVATSSLKGIEYLWLGAALAWLGHRKAGFLAAVGVGVVTGFGFATLATGVHLAVVGVDLAVQIPLFANEVLFPIGCSIALYGAEQLARRMVPPAAGT